MSTSWPNVPIKDVCLLAVDCVNKTAPVVDYQTPYRMLRTTNVRGGFVDAENTRFVTEETFEKWTRRGVPQKGDVILTREAPLGDVGRLTSENTVFLGQRLFMYRADPKKLNSQYLAYVLQSPLVQGRIKSKGFGATVEHARVGDCENLLIPVPDIITQERIGTILAAYDDLIENNKRRIELLEESARQLYKEWFVRFRFPGHEHAKIIDGVPEGWEILELQDVCERITDGAHHSPKGVDDGLPMASVKDMHSWGIDLKSCRKISHEDFEKLENGDCRPKQGDVLIAKDGSYLKHVFVAEDNAPYVLLSSIAILRPNERIKSNQLAMFLGLPQTKKRLTGYVSGVALPRIILKEFRRFSFLCPPIKLQEVWADNYDCIFDLCRNLIQENEKLAKARDLLLPKLMNGEIAV
jgi:type I restriction enzyme S subunit